MVGCWCVVDGDAGDEGGNVSFVADARLEEDGVDALARRTAATY